MNKFKQIKKGLLFVFAALSFTSCVHDDDYAVPPIETNLACQSDWSSNTSIADLIALNPDGAPMEITEDLILEGYVVSSDAYGNFFKSLVIQDSPADPSNGMSIEFDLYDTYRKFPVGYKVLVNAKGLYFGRDRATYKIGTTYTDDNGNLRLGRMSEVDAMDKVALACDEPTEIVPDVYTSIQDFKDNAVVNTLVKLENVQFDGISEGDTYYDENSSNTFGGATNRTLIDEEGNKIVLRTSQYTDFAGEAMPTGSGSIVAVLSAYSSNNNPTPSTYQLFLRDVSDINMDEPRFGGGTGGTGDGTTSGGDNATYNNCLDVDFQNYASEQDDFPEFINYTVESDRFWYIDDWDGNQFIKMSAYGAGGAADSYFIVPVDFEAADSFSFETEDRYNTGDVLTVYYSPDYTLGEELKTSNLVDITSAFTIASGTTGGASQGFVASGDYDLSSLSGKGAIVFRYYGTDGGVSTTMHIDNIKIVDNDDANCNGGGNNPTPDGLINENFDNGIPSDWINVAENGDRTWVVKEYDGVKYIQNSAYSSGGILDVKSWLVTSAIDFDAQADETLILKIADAYSNGLPLKVFYSTDYDGSSAPSSANWTEIGAAEIAALNENNGQYDNVYEETAPIDLSQINGTGYIALVYDSAASTISTTIQISEMIIK